MSRLLGSSQAAAEWVTRELGIDANRCAHITIDIDARGTVTVKATMFMEDHQLEALNLEGVVASRVAPLVEEGSDRA